MADRPDAPVYLLTGNDRPKIERALARLRRHFVPEAVETVSALDTDGESAVALCNAASLFGEGRLVVVEHVDGRPDAEGRRRGGWRAADVQAVAAYLRSPAPGTVLALVGEDVKPSSALHKACAKHGRVLAWSVDGRKDLVAWLAARFTERGVKVDAEACAALLQLVGEDLRALAAEVDKIATWAAGEPVGAREVEELVAPLADTPPYLLTEAWAERDGGRALAVSERIFHQEPRPRRETAARLAASLAGHLSRLREARRLAADGVPPKEAAARLRAHPFYARKLLAQAEGFSEEELGRAAVRLAALDRALKGESKLPHDLEVQRALAELASPPDGRRRADGRGARGRH